MSGGTVLVTGGAGYIGSHVVQALRRAGRPVLVVDDLSGGDAARVDGVPILRLDLAEQGSAPRIAAAAREHDVALVVHLAARKRVDESLRRPLWYSEQNVTGLLVLLRALADVDVRGFLFSSSAAVYGVTGDAPVTEQDPTSPVNPYGRTKLIGEQLLRDVSRATGLRTVSLRYFNVAGAGDPALADRGTGNLVTMTVDALRHGRTPEVFGTDYPTPDGTCVRDFVHVQDVADAHVAALDGLDRGDTLPDVLNVGTGQGASVLQVVEHLCAAAGRPGGWVARPRRAGDPPAVVADASRIHEVLGWHASRRLDEMLSSAWEAPLVG